jgi:small neutral amino acid transporter SnatA (MarC family)
VNNRNSRTRLLIGGTLVALGIAKMALRLTDPIVNYFQLGFGALSTLAGALLFRPAWLARNSPGEKQD